MDEPQPPDVLDLIDQAVFEITPEDIEESLHQVLEEAGYQPLQEAVRAVLKLHTRRERPVRCYDKPCAAHAWDPETRSFGSFEDVRSCMDCGYTEYYVCSHCDCPNDKWPCPTVQDIRAALPGGEQP